MKVRSFHVSRFKEIAKNLKVLSVKPFAGEKGIFEVEFETKVILRLNKAELKAVGLEFTDAK